MAASGGVILVFLFWILFCPLEIIILIIFFVIVQDDYCGALPSKWNIILTRAGLVL